ncbi:MAG: undecaprenyl-diphosphate phosphatase [Marinilabiliales bacterium]|nr:undecaprenyl-diphosphate phosphatase [Marinilabiliales bacterium]
MLGNTKEELARFSFLMVLVPVIGANMVEMVSGECDHCRHRCGSYLHRIHHGFYFRIFCMPVDDIRWLKGAELIWFAIYCAVAGVLTIIIG